MNRRRTIYAIFTLLFSLPVWAGGALETADITGNVPAPVAGFLAGRTIGIRWDVRMLPVAYSMNASLDPIPNPLGPPVLTVAQARTALQQSLETWNSLPTSYIQWSITGDTLKTSLRGFDFINELTFRSAANFGAIASSPSVSLLSDTTLVHGQLIDGDTDPDVSSAITVAADVDGDGDLEIPAGFYRAGTILENDVQFNTKTASAPGVTPVVLGGLRFTVDPAAADTNPNSTDLIGVAVHEFGHSLGLAHTPNNQSSDSDGTGATMFPFIDTGDPQDELAGRTLNSDDMAYASYFYPEGSAATGLPAIQSGDRPFSSVYGLITGEVTHGLQNTPIAGGAVFARDKRGNLVSSAFPGTTFVFVNAAGQTLVSGSPALRAFQIRDGRFTMPVPADDYVVGIEPLDGTFNPVPAQNIANTTLIGSIQGLQDFRELIVKKNPEANENSTTFKVGPGQTQTVNITTQHPFFIANYAAQAGFGFTGSPAGSYYAVQIPGSQLAAFAPGKKIRVLAVDFSVGPSDASRVPVYNAFLTTGVVNAAVPPATQPTATINLSAPLAFKPDFLGQDTDFTAWEINGGNEIGSILRAGIASGAIQNVFLVLQTRLGSPVSLVGLHGLGAAPGPVFAANSFFSTDGVTFNRLSAAGLGPLNAGFRLVLEERPVDE